jgi:hypothetical protein
MLGYAGGEQVVKDMPKAFADFGEVHRYFVHIMKRCVVFVQVRALHETLSTTFLPFSLLFQHHLKSRCKVTVRTLPIHKILPLRLPRSDGCRFTIRSHFYKQCIPGTRRIRFKHVLRSITTHPVPSRPRAPAHSRHVRQANAQACTMAALIQATPPQRRPRQPSGRNRLTGRMDRHLYNRQHSCCAHRMLLGPISPRVPGYRLPRRNTL